MRTEWYNSLGQLTWQQDERGRVSFSSHDPLTGSLTQAILDISSSAASSLSPPSGWAIPSDGLSVTTSYQFDSLGRVNQVLGPPHYNDQGNSVRTANWTVYDDPNHIVYTAAGYQTISSSACTTVNPVSIQQYDAEGRPLASIQATSGTATTSANSLLSLSTSSLSSLASTQSGYTRWTANQYSKTRLVRTAVYFLIPSSGTSDSNGFIGAVSTAGSQGVATGNYNLTTYGYESLSDTTGALMGGQNKVQGPGGTVTRTVLDVLGRATATWVGTNDSGATDALPSPSGSGGASSGNNMVQVSGGTLDIDGNLLQAAAYVSGTGARTTSYGYDWRGRRVTTTTNDGLNNSGTYYITQVTLDNLGRVTETQGYTASISASNLLTQSMAQFRRPGSRLSAADLRRQYYRRLGRHRPDRQNLVRCHRQYPDVEAGGLRHEHVYQKGL